MGLTLVTALEIFTHPDDLHIIVTQERGGKRGWGMGICRGPGHDFKVMLSTDAPLCLEGGGGRGGR